MRPALLTLILLAPLPFGSVEDWSRWLLITLIGLLFASFLWARIPFALERREKIAFGFACAYLLWLGIQMIPLPPALLSRLSPAAYRLYQIAVPGYAGPDSLGYAYPAPESIAALRDDTSPPEIEWITPPFTLPRSISLHPYGTYRVMCQTAALIAFAAMALALFRERRHLWRLAGALVAAGAFQALYGLFETLTGRDQIFWYQKRHYLEAVTGTLVNRNHYAAMLNLIVPLAMALAVRSSATGGGEGSASLVAHPRPLRLRLAQALQSLGSRRALLFAAAAVMGLAVVLSTSRMGIVSMLCGLLSLSIGMAWWGGKRLAWSAAAAPLLLLILIGVYSAGADASPAIERFFRLPDDLEASATRPALWRETLAVARDFLATGAGAGAFPHALNPNLTSLPLHDFWTYDHAHNDYLEAAVTIGAPGLTLVAAALALLCARSPRSVLSLGAAAALLTLLVHSLADFPLVIPSNALLACTLLCLMRGPAESQTMPAPPGTSPVKSARFRGLAAVAILAAVAFWPARSLAAAAALRFHDGMSGDAPPSRRAVEVAARVEPWNDLHLRSLARLHRDETDSIVPGRITLGEDLPRRIREVKLQRLEQLALGQTGLLAALDRTPVDYSLHTEVARITTRILTEAPNGTGHPADGPSALPLPPARASAALAPTAHANLAELGFVLWRGRYRLDPEASELALHFLRQARSSSRSQPPWLPVLLQSADSPSALARIDETLRPPSSTYAALIRSGAARIEADTLRCALALEAAAKAREAIGTSSKPSASAPPDAEGPIEECR